MSSTMDVSLSWIIVVARFGVGLLAGSCWGEGSLSCLGVRTSWLTVLRSRAWRLICLPSELVRGARSLVGSGGVEHV